MSETESSTTYTVLLNGNKYELNKESRKRIQQRAEREYEENDMFSCWWRVADKEDEDDDSTIHEQGDPILVIETEGIMVPWERLDQLEIEGDVSSFEEFDTGSGSDVDSGNGMKTVDPNEVDDGATDEEEIGRTHFPVTPQSFEEEPAPEGEQPDRIPAKPREFDEPQLMMWMPEDPEIDHTWGAGEAIAPMYNWVEWNVQVKADQPRGEDGPDDSHDHWESILALDGCEIIEEEETEQQSDESDSDDSDKDVARRFKEGTAGGDNWSV